MNENGTDFLTCILATDPGKDSNTDVNAVVKKVVFIVESMFCRKYVFSSCDEI